MFRCRNNNRAAGCDCSTCADDVGFVAALLDKVEADLCVDPNRVYLTGMSNGAMMVRCEMRPPQPSSFASARRCCRLAAAFCHRAFADTPA